jgi:hypothetical protein
MIRISVSGKLPNMKRKITKAVDEISRDLLDELKATTPVDTGFARSRWKKKGSINNRVIENDAEYISFLDDGSSSQAKNGMTKPAIAKIKANARRGKYTR